MKFRNQFLSFLHKLYSLNGIFEIYVIKDSTKLSKCNYYEIGGPQTLQKNVKKLNFKQKRFNNNKRRSDKFLPHILLQIKFRTQNFKKYC